MLGHLPVSEAMARINRIRLLQLRIGVSVFALSGRLVRFLTRVTGSPFRALSKSGQALSKS